MAKNLVIKTTFKAVDKTSRVMGKMQRRVLKFTAKTSMALRKVDRVATKVAATLGRGLKAGALALAGGAIVAGGAIAALMRQFSKIEDAEAAFTPLLGGTKKAKEMVEALNKTAATTPFQFEDLAGVAKQLLPSMNGDIAETIKLTRMLGDTAGGNAQNMESITRGYNKALLKGKVDMEALNMISEAGVPIFSELATSMGLSAAQMFKQVSKGKVTTEILTGAFEKMTSKGGIFFEGMKIASQTLSGKLSTLKDNAGQAMAALGSALAPTLKDLADTMNRVAIKAKAWFEANKDLIKSKIEGVLKFIGDNIGTIWFWVKKIAGGIAIFYGIVTAIKAINAVMLIFNTLAAMNPIGLIIIGFVAALAVIALFRDEIDAFMFSIFDTIVSVGLKISDFLTLMWNSPRDAFAVVWDWILAYFTGTFDFLASIFNGWLEGMKALLGIFIDIFTGDWDAAGEKFMNIWEKMKSAAKSVLDWIKSKLAPLVSTFGKVADFFDFGAVEDSVRHRESGGDGVIKGAPPRVVRPSVDISSTSSESVQRNEVTLIDQTGKARHTRGSGGPGFKLAHTGGMAQ